jgi:RNA recognition motif-containing protein
MADTAASAPIGPPPASGGSSQAVSQGFDAASVAGAGAAALKGSTAAAPASTNGSKEQGPPGCCLFVYHIPITWTDAELEQTFLPLAAPGRLLSATVFKDKATGTSKGFGFVNYDNPASAQNAISAMHGMEVDGKRLRVEIKKPRGATSGGGGGGGGGASGSAVAAMAQQASTLRVSGVGCRVYGLGVMWQLWPSRQGRSASRG